MGQGLLVIYLFLQKWLVPFLFAIGLIFFVYGTIVYYIIGHKSGDEDRMEHGRESLMRAFVFFSIALLVYLLVFLIGWAGSVMTETSQTGQGTTPRGKATVEERQSVLGVPDVPQNND